MSPMAKTDDTPFELFKQALAATAKAMSQTRDVEVSYSAEAGRADEGRLILQTPPRELSPKQAARARGEADAISLRLAHHDAAAHNAERPSGEMARQVYEAAERARIESIGANAMDGTAANLDAALAARCEKAGYTRMQDRTEAPIAPAIEFLLRFLLFSIGPLIIELFLVGIVLWAAFDFWYLAVVMAVIGAYVAFTFKVTEWRVKLRKVMNDQDTDANQKAIDSLLNFETVKYFGAEGREAARYDQAMAGYEAASIKTATSLAFLNFGQSVLITLGLIIVMVMAAVGVQNGSLTVGDFVMVNAYMIQITMPLNFLGFVYREIKQSLIDIEAMFHLLNVAPEIDGIDLANICTVDKY